jgi:glycosyltransferase involved in cell wall biosynthesis
MQIISKGNRLKAVVCLPTRNEEKSIATMISKINSLGLPLFITDANSTDKTVQIAALHGIKNYKRDGIGKGWGIRKAIKVAEKQGYDIIVFLDCDCTYPPEDIPKLLSRFPKYDMVIGTRGMKNIPETHRLPNLFHTTAVNLLFFGRYTDINSGMRAFKVKKMRGLRSEGFDIEAEMSCKALKRGLKIKEIPIKYRKRVGESKIKVRDGLIILWRIVKERFTA